MEEIKLIADGYTYVFPKGGLEETIIEIYNGNNKELKQYQLSEIYGVTPARVRLIRYALSLAGLLVDEYGEPVSAFTNLEDEVDETLEMIGEGLSIIEIANRLNISTTTISRIINAWNLVLEWRGEAYHRNDILEVMEQNEIGTEAEPYESMT